MPGGSKSRKQRGSSWHVAIGFVAAAVLLGLCFAAWHLHTPQHDAGVGGQLRANSNRGATAAKGSAGRAWGSHHALGPPVHIVLCTDDTDLRALLVAIKTAIATAEDPRRFVFHVVTATELAPLFDALLRLHVKGVTVQIHHDPQVEARIKAMVPYKAASSTTVRAGLASPFNFASFFLHDYFSEAIDAKSLDKVIVLDTDVVVRGDLAELLDVDLAGQAVAAVKDCKTRYEDVFNLPEIAKFSSSGLEPRECVLQRGVHVVDVLRWRERDLASKVEVWLRRFRDAEDILWHEGFAQPAWLLAVDGSYKELDPLWNCYNLGKPTSNYEEAAAVRRMGFDHKALLYDLTIALSKKYGTMKPFVSTCAPAAKLLHFSGELKPWLAEVWLPRTPAPVCFIPLDLKIPNRTGPEYMTVLHGETQRLVRCYELWWVHLNIDEDCSLKDLEKEWVEDEQMWHDELKRDLKAKKEAAELKKQEMEAKKKQEEEEAEKAKKEGKSKEDDAQKKAQEPEPEDVQESPDGFGDEDEEEDASAGNDGEE